MSNGYVPVQWNGFKKNYDKALWLVIVLYVVLFMGVSSAMHSGADALSPMALLIRAFGSLAFILLTLILCIGPLARLNTRFLPLLYNRRHMGVSMFIIALLHGALVIMWYHGFGVINPIESIFSSLGSFDVPSDVPFQRFGFLALLILFVMAATSHDYWNANLSAPVWKAIHMAVYLAYGLVIVHLAYGAMMDKTTGLSSIVVLSSVLLVSGLHIVSGLKSCKPTRTCQGQEWVDIGNWMDIPNNRAITVSINDEERIAVFRYDTNKLAAVSNACQHQNGPLGEGRVIDGLITCPWHGFQYKPEDGRAPCPFTERIATYQLKLDGSKVFLNPSALAQGTPRPVVEIPGVISLKEQADV